MMKLILENWRRYVNEADQSGPQRDGPRGEMSISAEELKFSHNLFVDYIQNELDDPEHPELVEFIKNYDSGPNEYREWYKTKTKREYSLGRHTPKSVQLYEEWRRLKVQANKRMHQEWKWDFPHDIDPEIPCFNKLFYLDVLVKSYYNHPKYYDTQEKAPAVTEAAGDISPYRKCRFDLRSKKATEKEMEPYELSLDPEKE